jgi:DNA-directed RNA polymerase specialized sigma24 family protein
MLDPTEAAVAEDDPWLKRLEQTIEDLSPGKKTALSLFYIRGLSHEMIADFLDIPVGTVKRQLFEARQAMAASADAPDEMSLAEQRRFVAAVKRMLSTQTPKEPS